VRVYIRITGGGSGRGKDLFYLYPRTTVGPFPCLFSSLVLVFSLFLPRTFLYLRAGLLDFPSFPLSLAPSLPLSRLFFILRSLKNEDPIILLKLERSAWLKDVREGEGGRASFSRQPSYLLQFTTQIEVMMENDLCNIREVLNPLRHYIKKKLYKCFQVLLLNFH
jgi:hypothetical protein